MNLHPKTRTAWIGVDWGDLEMHALEMSIRVCTRFETRLVEIRVDIRLLTWTCAVATGREWGVLRRCRAPAGDFKL